MDTGNDDFDPLKEGEDQITTSSDSTSLAAQADQLRARADAFRDLADRFYMLWWNIPGMSLRQVDQDVQDMFRMYMDLAPTMGVSRNGIPELRECCGRKRTWKDDPLTGPPGQVLVMPPVTEPIEKLGWCPGDIVRRITQLFGVKYCEACDLRRRRINAWFGCYGD
jgi:hypothetical protein